MNNLTYNWFQIKDLSSGKTWQHKAGKTFLYISIRISILQSLSHTHTNKKTGGEKI